MINSVTRVSELNTIMGNKMGNELAKDEYLAGIQCQVQLVREEFLEELFEAKCDRDVFDAIGDSITVIDGLPFRFGFNIFDETFSSVVESIPAFNPNGSHYVRSEEEINTLKERVESILVSLETLATLRGEKETRLHERFMELWKELRTIVEQEAVWWRNTNPMRAFLEVHNSNLSKACDSLEELDATFKKYQKEYGFSYMAPVIENAGLMPRTAGIDLMFTEPVVGKFVVKTATSLMMGDKRVKAGKFLKSVSFKEPNFSNEDHFKLITL